MNQMNAKLASKLFTSLQKYSVHFKVKEFTSRYCHGNLKCLIAIMS